MAILRCGWLRLLSKNCHCRVSEGAFGVHVLQLDRRIQKREIISSTGSYVSLSDSDVPLLQVDKGSRCTSSPPAARSTPRKLSAACRISNEDCGQQSGEAKPIFRRFPGRQETKCSVLQRHVLRGFLHGTCLSLSMLRLWR